MTMKSLGSQKFDFQSSQIQSVVKFWTVEMAPVVLGAQYSGLDLGVNRPMISRRSTTGVHRSLSGCWVNTMTNLTSFRTSVIYKNLYFFNIYIFIRSKFSISSAPRISIENKIFDTFTISCIRLICSFN